MIIGKNKIIRRLLRNSILLFSLLCLGTHQVYSADQTVKGIVYTQVASTWYSIEASGARYPVDTTVLMVRLNTKGDVGQYNFVALGLPQLAVVVPR
jgi:hypothetical protein